MLRSPRAICVGLSCLTGVPIFLVVVFGIWGPAAIIWETFGVHYTALPTISLNYHFIGNAIGFSVLYAYVPSLIVHWFLPETSSSEKMQIYLLGVYAIHFLLIMVTAWWLSSRPMALASKIILIVSVGIVPIWLSANYVNVFSANYFWLATVIYFFTSILWVSAMNGTLRMGTHLAAFIGAAFAVATLTKFTYAFTIGPFLIAPLLMCRSEKLGRTIVAFLGAAVAATLLIFMIYFVGHFDFFGRFIEDVEAMYSFDYIFQSTPELLAELTGIQFRSAIQLTSVLAAVATTLGSIKAIRDKSPVTWTFLITSIAAITLFIPFLHIRTSANSFVDTIIFLCFVIGVWSASFFQARPWRAPGVTLFMLLVALTLWQVFGVFGLTTWLQRLQSATESTSEVYLDIHERDELPIVYYWSFPNGRGPIWHGPALFPSPYLYALISGKQITKFPYLQKYFPRESHRAVLDGIFPAKHIMVIQEIVGNESSFQIWADQLGFDRAVKNADNRCRRHDVTLAWTDFPALGRSRVTVCQIDK